MSAAPAIYLANEFFDALPVHQAVRAREGWHERVVAIGDDGRLRFGIGAPVVLPHFLANAARDAPCGVIVEWRSHELAGALVAHGMRIDALTPEIARLGHLHRGDNVPAGATAADMIQR